MSPQQQQQDDQQTQATSVLLTSLDYDNVEEEENQGTITTIVRPEGSNLDFVTTAAAATLLVGQNGTGEVTNPTSSSSYHVCHLISWFGYVGTSGSPIIGHYENALAASLAAHHWNTGDNVLVEEVADYRDTAASSSSSDYPCNLKLTVGFHPTGFQTGEGLNAAIDLTDKASGRKLPCAFVGADRSAMSIPTSMITNLRGYPQISGSSSSKVLDDKTAHPLFARTISSDYENSPPILQFLRNHFHAKHVAVLHMNEPYGIAYANGLREAVKNYYPDVNLAVVTMPYSGIDTDAIVQAVESLKLTRYRYFFCIAFDVFDEILLEAHQQGIAGHDGYNWIFSDSFGLNYLTTQSFPRGLPSTRCTREWDTLDSRQGSLPKTKNLHIRWRG